MKSIRKTDLVKAGVRTLAIAQDYRQAENIEAYAAVANAYARLAEALDEDIIMVPDEWV